MKKVVAVLRDYFGVSQREARGMLALLILTGFLLLLPLLYRLWIPDTIPDTTASDQRQLDSLVALLETDETATPESRENDTGRDEPLVEPRKTERFGFDPNALDAENWQRLGVPRWLAERIVKYRSKGGRFRQADDLLKIYDFPPELYEELKPYIRLNALAASEKPYPNSREQRTENERFHEKPYVNSRSDLPTERFRKPVLQAFDINTADTTTLKQLRGIGSKLAGRIIKFRDALGGFVAPEQYAEVFGLDSLALAELTHYARVQTLPKKIAVNTATVEEFDRHVYLSRRQAEVLVNYRNQHGPFASPESLRNIRILDARTIEKLTPYLEF